MFFENKKKYTAPELLTPNVKYGSEVDIYSLSFILYEMFSGQLAFEDMSPHQLIMAVCMLKQRPEFDSKFPTKLGDKIKLGWTSEPKDRCKLDDFLQILLEMKNSSSSKTVSPRLSLEKQLLTLSIREQAENISQISLPYSSIIEMKWPEQTAQTKSLIENMIKEMKESSSFTSIFSQTILKAMLQIPKHYFIDMNLLKSSMKLTDENQCLNTIYQYSKALRACQTQNISSTEITCAQLSLIPLNSGDRVLFLGAKGGYIQTIAAQTVGFQGEVWICSQDNEGLEQVRTILQTHVPPILRQLIKCILVKNIQNVNEIKQSLEGQIKSVNEYFNSIHVCGAIPQESLEYFQQFLQIEGQILAPISIDKDHQKFTVLHKTRHPTSGQNILNKRILNDWGIIFAPVL